MHQRNILRFYALSNEFGAIEININNVKPVFFIVRASDTGSISSAFERKPVNMKNFAGAELDAVYFNTYNELKEGAAVFEAFGISTYEADVDPVRRFLMERGINGSINITGEALNKGGMIKFNNPKIKSASTEPHFKILSLDIETGSDGKLFSTAMHITGRGDEAKVVLINADSEERGEDTEDKEVKYYYLKDEKEVLKDFEKFIRVTDPDIIIGWHVIGFDLMFLEKKFNQYRMPFSIGRGAGRIRLTSRPSGGYFAFIPGRVVIDGPPALRGAFYSFEDYKLETVSRELIGSGKTISAEQNKVEEIERLYKEDKRRLADYNLNDSVLVTRIFEKTGLLKMNIKRVQLSGMLMDKLGMMTAAFDHFYLPKLHRAGYAAPNVKDIITTGHAAGGYVMEPEPGIYDDVIVLDFKSLYPSIIRTFKIDPLSRLLSEEDTITTPGGYRFSAAKHFLPDFIAELMELRGEAKKNNDKYLSYAIKILMNSFYGVMGSYGCRFYHKDLPSAITGTGQFLLLESREYFNRRGYTVIYGDTDSLFIKLKDEEGEKAAYYGERLAADLNSYWEKRLRDQYGVTSFLEIEFEKHYLKFIVTQARGGEAGAKKRYAGIVAAGEREELEFVGMESVRSDWTRLSKEFQAELYMRIFKGEEIKVWIRSIIEKLQKGEFDDKLIYRKRLRKGINNYINLPPQVKAAQLLQEEVDSVNYVITKRGPVPIELEPSDIDYRHYIEKQLKPVADSILQLMGYSFDQITKPEQLNMFGAEN